MDKDCDEQSPCWNKIYVHSKQTNQPTKQAKQQQNTFSMHCLPTDELWPSTSNSTEVRRVFMGHFMLETNPMIPP